MLDGAVALFLLSAGAVFADGNDALGFDKETLNVKCALGNSISPCDKNGVLIWGSRFGADFDSTKALEEKSPGVFAV